MAAARWGNNGGDMSLSELVPQQSAKQGKTSQNTETEHLALLGFILDPIVNAKYTKLNI